MTLIGILEGIIAGVISGVLVSFAFYLYESNRLKKENFMRDKQNLNHYISLLRLEIEIMKKTNIGDEVVRMVEDRPISYSFNNLNTEYSQIMHDFSELLDDLKEIAQKNAYDKNTLLRISSKLLIARSKILKFKL